MTTRWKHLSALTALSVVLFCLPGSSWARVPIRAAQADDPILGFWDFRNVTVQVTADGSGFAGKVANQRVTTCSDVGEQIWTVEDKVSATEYEGTTSWYNLGDCSDRGQGVTTWTYDEANDTLTQFTTDPSAGNSESNVWTRSFDLSGTWDWTDTLSDGTTVRSTAEIAHNVGAGTFTWTWGGKTGNGTVAVNTWKLDWVDGSITYHYDGTILEDGARLEGSWYTSNGAYGGSVAISGTAPETPPQCDDAGAICGGTEDEELQGTPESEFIFGGGGNDQIDGGGGNDVIVGGEGNDLVMGGTGKDKVTGGAGKDKIYGDTRGVPNPSAQDAWIRASQAEGSADQLSGGGGEDVVVGQAGNDKLKGDAGNDTLKGGSGVNDFNGGPGKDTCVLDNKKDETKSCEKKKFNFKFNFFPYLTP